MKIFLLTLLSALVLGTTPALAGDHGGGGGMGGGGGCGGGCGGGYGGGGHPGGGGYEGGGHGGGYGGGYNQNVNVNVNANANAYAGATAGAGSYINARAYDVGAIRGGGGYGGVVSTGGDYGYGAVGGYGYGYGGGVIVANGPGYGPSRPYGYTVQGFGRRYVTTDRCGSCGHSAPPAPPPQPSCHSGCSYGGGYSGGYGQGQYEHGGGDRYSDRRDHAGSQGGGCGCSSCGCDGPRYVAQPYYAAPLEPVSYPVEAYSGGTDQQVYQGGHSAQTYESQSYQSQGYQGGGYQGGYQSNGAQGYGGQPYAAQSYSAQSFGDGQGYVDQSGYAPPPVTYAPPQVIQQAPVYIQAPADYYGDLPLGDSGQGQGVPYQQYRQEPGERG